MVSFKPWILGSICLSIGIQKRNEFNPVGLENSETPSLSEVWPSDHRRTIGLVLCPCTALYRSFLKRCTLTNKAVGTIWRGLSKPPQRRQGPDPRPLWLLIGTPSAFGPELAYRLRVAQPTLMYVPIYFWHFYDLSALVGCWSSVYIRRQKGEDLTQSYDKSPYTNRNVKRAKWQHKQRHKKVRLNSNCGPT